MTENCRWNLDAKENKKGPTHETASKRTGAEGLKYSRETNRGDLWGWSVGWNLQNRRKVERNLILLHNLKSWSFEKVLHLQQLATVTPSAVKFGWTVDPSTPELRVQISLRISVTSGEDYYCTSSLSEYTNSFHGALEPCRCNLFVYLETLILNPVIASVQGFFNSTPQITPQQVLKFKRRMNSTWICWGHSNVRSFSPHKVVCVYLQLCQAPVTAPLHHFGLILVISWPDRIAADTVFAAARGQRLCVCLRARACVCVLLRPRVREGAAVLNAGW